MAVGTANGPSGLIEFRNCTTKNTGKEGVKVFDQSADSVRIRFVNCSWKNPWVSRHADYGGPRVPILIHLRRPELTQDPGGIDFVDCHVYDDAYRPVLQFEDGQFGASRRPADGSAVVLAILGAAIVLWVTEEVPLFVTSLAIPIVLAVAEVATAGDALAPFFDPIIVLFFGGFLMAQAMRRAGLDSSPPRVKKVEGELWLLNCPVLQQALRAVLEMRTSSILPLNEFAVVSPPRCTF